MKPPCVHLRFVGVFPFGFTPDFGRFYGSRGSSYLLRMPRSPKTSLVAHAPPTGSPTDGLLIFLLKILLRLFVISAF
jgi:hypothetical protein